MAGITPKTDQKAKGEMDSDNENDTFVDANQTGSRPSTSNGPLANAATNPASKLPNVSTEPEQYETSEVLFSSESVDHTTEIVDGAAHKLQQDSGKQSNGEPRRPSEATSPPPDSSDGFSSFAAKRKLFGWLSRPTSIDSAIKSPFSQSRRGTMTSTMSAESGGETKPGDNPEDTETVARKIHRNSLKDRFKFVRMREEAGIITLEDQDGNTVSGPKSRPQSTQDASNLVMADSEAAEEFARRRKSSASRPKSPDAVLINENLPPGSAVGAVTGPSSGREEAVDWDLWQEVVYEGPAAVARTSSTELSLAIRRGIPSAIRGVVWQVLAQSKNEDLEDMYKELVARGTDGDRTASELKPSSFSRPTSTSRPGSDVFSPPSSAKEKAPSSTSDNDGKTGDEKEVPPTPDPEAPKAATSQSSAVSDAQPASHDPSRRNSASLFSPVTSPGVNSLSKSMTAPVYDEQQKIKEEVAALQKLERAIKRDLGTRTSFSKFLMSAGLQDGLFGVCKAYALFDEDVGYAQGMNFIAMPLLFNMPEEEAFCLFVRLMNQYRLRDLFIQDMPGLHLHLYQFERLLEEFEPAVYCHLHRRGVQPQLYATQWFLTLFAYRFPLQLVLRIYDLILSEGLESAILKFGVVLMQKNAKTLLEMRDMSALTTFLKERLFDVYIDKSPSASSLLESGFFGSAGGIDKEVYRADALVEDACEVPVTPEMLKQYAKEWEEKVADEKEKADVLEHLRTQNSQLTSQLRSKAQHAETLDNEHVQLASDLVHTKIANQTLTDQNESLTQRVAELQSIIDAQPAQVEERLRAEMERIMTRNAEVQHENRALEEQCTEVEGELANAKMKVAEMAGELEAMRNRWRNMEGLMKSP